MEFKVDQQLYWLHGEHHRIANVIRIEGDYLVLSGVQNKEYKMKKMTALRKINKPYPIGHGGANYA